MWINLGISILAGIVVTIVVLLTRIMFYRIRDVLPAGSLFHGIKGISDPCLVFIRRMASFDLSGKFKTPRPQYKAVFNDSTPPYSQQFDENKNIPWVTSTSTAGALAHVLNILGHIGRVNNIEVIFADKDYDRWDAPMFIIGGSCKSQRAFETCNPYFRYNIPNFKLLHTGESFTSSTTNEDIGLLQKMINPTNGKPVWLIIGLRGEATVAAAYALVRWWRYLGWLYGKKTFGLLVSCNDKDGWQHSHIVTLYPKPNWFTRLIHFHSWNNLNQRVEKEKSYEQQ